MLSEGSSLDAQLQGSCCILVHYSVVLEYFAVRCMSALLQHRYEEAVHHTTDCSAHMLMCSHAHAHTQYTFAHMLKSLP